MSRVLIVGYGSIGARHARLLAAAGSDVACVTRNADCPYPRHGAIVGGVAAFAPTHIVISNETSRHANLPFGARGDGLGAGRPGGRSRYSTRHRPRIPKVWT